MSRPGSPAAVGETIEQQTMKDGHPISKRYGIRSPAATRALRPAGTSPTVRTTCAHTSRIRSKPGRPLASAVRLRMHWVDKLKHWRKFRAEQVIVRGRGMIWRATGAHARRADSRMRPLARRRSRDAMEAFGLHSAGTRIGSGHHALDRGPCRRGIDLAAVDVLRQRRVVASPTGRARPRRVSRSTDTRPNSPLRSIRAGAVGRSFALGQPRRRAVPGSFLRLLRRPGSDVRRVHDSRADRVGWYVDDPARFDSEGKFIELSVDDAVYR